jgi:hypothetical protein
MVKAGMGMIKAPQPITIEELKTKFPKKKNSITQEGVDIINATLLDPEFDASTFIDDMVTYENVMHTSSLNINEYINVVRFCAYLQSNPDSLIEAYKRTFAHRDFVKDRWTATSGSKEYNELTSAASRYRASPGVVKVMTQAMVPMHILFAGMRYQAINVLATEMTTAMYSKDRISAAKELLAAVKPPDNIKIDLDVGVKENSAVQQLNEQLASFASNSMVHLQAGTTNLSKLGSMKVAEDIEDAEVS